MMPEQTN